MLYIQMRTTLSSSQPIFPLKDIIRSALSKDTTINGSVFYQVVEAVETWHGRQVSSITDLKARDNKHLKGRAWESFCKEWLLATGKYKEVWFLWEMDTTVINTLKLKKQQDNGIDLIAFDGSQHVAIQCKYRRKVKNRANRVPWA